MRLGWFGLFLVLAGIPARTSAEFRWERLIFGNDVRDLAAADGWIWWATTGGLVRMDLTDTTFTIWRREDRGLPSDSLNALAFDADGNLWCGTASEGIVVRMAEGGWRFLRTFDGLPDSRVLSLSATDGAVTVGTGAGFATFTGFDSLTSVCTLIDPCADDMPSLVIQAVATFGDTTWYGTSEGPVRQTHVGAEVVLDSLTTGLGDPSVRAFASFGGEVWTATGGGVYRFDSGVESWVSTRAGDFRDLAVSGGRFFAASASPNRVWELTGGTWTNITPSSAFPAGKAPRALEPDRAGRVWCGTTGGVAVYDPADGAWSEFFTVDGPPSPQIVYSADAGARDEVWFGFLGSGRAAAFDGARWWPVDVDASRDDDVRGLLVDESGRVWLGHCCCMSDLPDCPAYVGTGAEPDDLEWTPVQAWNVAAFVEDGAGRIWMGGADDDVPELGGSGLYLWDATLPLGQVETFQQGQAPTVPLSSSAITDLAVDAAGKLWIAHREDGVDVWSFGADPRDGVGDRWRHLEYSTIEDDPDFITSNEVLSLAADGSRVWIGSASGVTLYEADLVRGWWFGSALGSPFVRSLAVTEDHSAWAGTSDGLVRFTPNAVGTFDLEHHRFPDLSSDDIHEITAEGNTVWLATRRGITRGEPVAPESAGRARGIGYPNPFRAAAHDGVRLLDVTVAVDGEVYDAAGGRVATFRGVKPGEVVWNGHIENGRGGQGLAAPGIYTIVARSGDLTVTTSIALVR